MLEREPAREEACPTSSQPVQLEGALAERFRDAVADRLGRAAAAELHRLATELASLLSPNWDLADVLVSTDDNGPCFLLILTNSSGQWMRRQDLPTTFHGITVWPLFSSGRGAGVS